MKKQIFLLIALCGALSQLGAQAAFSHLTTAANTGARAGAPEHITVLDHPQLNGKPDAVVFVTTNWGKGGAGIDYRNNVGVWYNGTRWTIFNQNKSAMPERVTFNVMVVPAGTPGVFTHTCTAANTGGSAGTFNNRTILDNPVCNGKVAVMLLVTQNGIDTYNDNPIQVGNTGGCGLPGEILWGISNGSIYPDSRDYWNFPMPEGARFNVMVIEDGKVPGFPAASAFVHIAKTETIIPAGHNITFLDHPAANGKPEAIVFATPFWGRGTMCSEGPYPISPISVWYDNPADVWHYKEHNWSVYNSIPGRPMPPEAKFNIVIIPGLNDAPISGNTQFFSPLNASSGSPGGPETNRLIIKPYCCPSTALEVSARTIIADSDLQWVDIPLQGITAGPLSSVTVCYQVLGTGNSFISQVRLSEMTTPDKTTVMLDDGTDLKSTKPTCYTTKADYNVTGTTTLSLRIALAKGDKIVIGGISTGR